MIDFWPLIGIAIITVGLALKLNTLLVILVAGVATGLVADIAVMEILSILGQSFTQNRYMSLFILILPMIGILERYGLRQRAERLIGSMKKASVSKILMTYLLLRKVTNGMGLSIGGHPSMVRPLIAPMAEAAAEKASPKLAEEKRQAIRALSAASENVGNFFSQLLFIGTGGILLIKGVMADNQLDVQLETMALWALPTAIASFVVFVVFSKVVEAKLLKSGINAKPMADEQGNEG
ncbi:DUF969 domain-containing protein [Grimontia hollisae]|uniref:Permease n=2 Tax=Grimontia hollisae TaxID=673 RepID=D0I9G3_GRIHO|nr:DUF969 domain-containing protein [Grimontia hollisae]AMG29369.1 DUF969 domain-containing protein [Grimontia hollisae]EEY72078.1 permease [Grimontia hollisae CIP 101886]MDF2184001.1 DUF969 domain-containing protein [Grimontia hollisae]STO77626.1 Protein of uncharacterised function (DUF969) [Grimontia hollisae]STO98583.1 Protein of uncharacterised function (DUF969) [Grimontia hollisae]